MIRILGVVVVCLSAMLAEASAQTQTSQEIRSLRITSPHQWVANKTFTLKAEIVNIRGEIDWTAWEAIGSVVVRRAGSSNVVQSSTFVFDTHDGVPPEDSIHIRNGVGSVSISLDDPQIESAGSVDVEVSAAGLTSVQTIELLVEPRETALAGILQDPTLTWSPSMGVVHLTADVVVPAGKVLRIDPGTMIMVDPGPPNSGTRIIVHGRVEAVGSAAEPIFFFPTTGVAGLHFTADCAEPVYNVNAWRGIVHYNAGPSEYRHVFVTGAGNAPVTGHRRAPILNFTHDHDATITDCVFADNNGKAIYGTGSNGPVYTIARTLISRCGHGVEFTESGDYSLLVEDCYFMDVGFAPLSCERNGDFLNIRADIPANGGPKVVRRCVFAEAGDEAIDHKGTHIVLEDCIIRGLSGNAISMESDTGGSLTMTECLVFDSASTAISAIRMPLFMTNCTVVNARTLTNTDGIASVIRGCLFSGNRWRSCFGSVTGCNLPPNSTVTCTLGNTFLAAGLDATTFNFTVSPTSLLATANTDGGQMGWSPARFDTPVATATPPAIAGVFATATTVPGVGSVANEDVLAFDTADSTWQMIVDGSDLGLAAQMIDALAVLPDGSFLFSFSADSTVPGLLNGPDGINVDDADIVRFIPVTLGDSTSGTLAMYFDGSDVGLLPTSNAHDIDSVSVDAAGNLLISTLGLNTVLGATSQDEDILRFTPVSLGAVTTGSWSMAVQGASIALADSDSEDIDGVATLPDNSLLFSTAGDFTSGVSGTGLDVAVTQATAFAGSSSIYFSPAGAGIDPTRNLSALEFFPGGSAGILDQPGTSQPSVVNPQDPAGRHFCEADVNLDGLVDETDLVLFLDAFVGSGQSEELVMDADDVNEFLIAYQRGCP